MAYIIPMEGNPITVKIGEDVDYHHVSTKYDIVLKEKGIRELRYGGV